MDLLKGGLNMKKITTLFIALIFLAGCASTGDKKTAEPPQAKKGFLNGYYEKMEPGPKGGAKMRWLKPGVEQGDAGQHYLLFCR